MVCTDDKCCGRQHGRLIPCCCCGGRAASSSSTWEEFWQYSSLYRRYNGAGGSAGAARVEEGNYSAAGEKNRGRSFDCFCAQSDFWRASVSGSCWQRAGPGDHPVAELAFMWDASRKKMWRADADRPPPPPEGGPVVAEDESGVDDDAADGGGEAGEGGDPDAGDKKKPPRPPPKPNMRDELVVPFSFNHAELVSGGALDVFDYGKRTRGYVGGIMQRGFSERCVDWWRFKKCIIWSYCTQYVSSLVVAWLSLLLQASTYLLKKSGPMLVSLAYLVQR